MIVPWRPDGPQRQVVWAHLRARWAAAYPQWDIVTGTCADGPWSKGGAVADALRHTDAQLLLVADADVWCDGVPRAVDAVRSGRTQWAIPHGTVYRLTEEATRLVLAGGPMGGPMAEVHRGRAGGGLVVLTRRLITGVPMDPVFTGWGQEDDAWALALETLAGPGWRGEAPLMHLWHPPAPRRSRAIGSAESLARYRRYQAASGQVAQMRALISEFCDTPLEDVPMPGYVYENENTGQVVDNGPTPNARFERLANWHRVVDEQSEPEQDTAPRDGVLSQPDLEVRLEAPGYEMEQRPSPNEGQQSEAEQGEGVLSQPQDAPSPSDPEPAPSASTGPERPTPRDSKAAWLEYARRVAKDSDEQAEAEDMTKAELMARYGGEG